LEGLVSVPAARRLFPLTLTALGVVYGDIGTSPLYAMRECFFGTHAVPPTHDNVLGVLSLIIYSLVFVISIKYVAIVMRADNQGEGGVLALTSLVPGRGGTAAARRGLRWAARCSSPSASSGPHSCTATA
jgi:KUP system potassium uptake protein